MICFCGDVFLLICPQCLKVFSNLPEDSRSLGSLDHIFTSKDERARLTVGQKRKIDNFEQIEKEVREELHNGVKSNEWPPEHPKGFGDSTHDRSRRLSVENGVKLRLDQVFSSRGGRGE